MKARENSVISYAEMEEKLFTLLDDQEIYAALFKGDDPKSWYPQLGAWKKEQFDKVYDKWRDARER